MQDDRRRGSIAAEVNSTSDIAQCDEHCAAARADISPAAPSASSAARPASPHLVQVRGRIPDENRRRSTAKALALFVPFFALYAVTLAATAMLPYLPLQVLAAAINSVVLAILFVMGHDACHGAFTPYRWLNQLLGRICFLPSWHPYAGWEHAHNHVHHAWTNLRGKDYAWSPLTKAEYDRLGPPRRWLARFYRSPWGFGAYYLFNVYLKRTIFPRRVFWGSGSMAILRADCLLVLAFIVGQAAYLLAAASLAGSRSSPVLVLAVGQLLPFLIWNWLIGFLIFLHHTHPRVPWFDDRRQWSYYAGQIQGAAHVVFPWGINSLIQHIMEHTAHHVDPRIPLYELSTAQRSLELAYPNDVVIQPFSFKSLMYTVRVCQLYDFERHRWVSFTGEPTSGPTIWPLPTPTGGAS